MVGRWGTEAVALVAQVGCELFIAFQAMLQDVSEGKPLEPLAILPSARSQVGLGQHPGYECGAEVGAQACAA